MNERKNKWMNEWINEWTDTECCETWLPTLTEHIFQIFENTLFDHKRNEDILEEMKAETILQEIKKTQTKLATTCNRHEQHDTKNNVEL